MLRTYHVLYRKAPGQPVETYTTKAHTIIDAWCRADRYLALRYPNYQLQRIKRDWNGLTVDTEALFERLRAER